MSALHIFLHAEEMLEDIDASKVVEAKKENIRVGVLPKGMNSGNPSVSFGFELPDGRYVFAETSLKLFQLAAKAFTAKYGEVK